MTSPPSPAPFDDATRLAPVDDTRLAPLDDATRLAGAATPPLPAAPAPPAPPPLRTPPLRTPPTPLPAPPRAATSAWHPLPDASLPAPPAFVPAAPDPVPVPQPPAPVRPTPAPPSGTVLARRTIGSAPGQAVLLGRPSGTRTEATRLEHDRQVLPELEELPPARPLYRRPAFVVSLAIAVVAVLTCVTLVVVQHVTRRPPAVASVTLQDVGDYYLLEWEGPDVPYRLVLTTADGADPADVSSLVRGQEAWVPKTSAHVTPDSCLVVLAVEVADDHAFTVDPADLAAQGGAMACVADADA